MNQIANLTKNPSLCLLLLLAVAALLEGVEVVLQVADDLGRVLGRFAEYPLHLSTMYSQSGGVGFVADAEKLASRHLLLFSCPSSVGRKCQRCLVACTIYYIP